MISLERISGISPQQADLLQEHGVQSADDLAAVDAMQLHRMLESCGRQRGKASLIPSLITLRLWKKLAAEICQAKMVDDPVDPDDVPEAISIDDIPEVIVEAPPQAPPQPPSREEVRLETPTRGQRDTWPSETGFDKSRFQTFDDYKDGARGIEPLKRTANVATDPPAEQPKYRPDGTLSRRTRRGVLYPHPLRAVLGALGALFWRLGLIASLIFLPWYILSTEEKNRSGAVILLWALGFLLLAAWHWWAAVKVRCRVCSCPLFLSRRCAKNPRAHFFRPFGYVASLALHLLTFHWFRCMYCGTALRLFGGRHAETNNREQG